MSMKLPFPALSVSIHVPLAEHDALTDVSIPTTTVSIHVPLAEHDVLTA